MFNQWISNVNTDCGTRSMRRNSHRNMDSNRCMWKNSDHIKNDYSYCCTYTDIYRGTQYYSSLWSNTCNQFIKLFQWRFRNLFDQWNSNVNSDRRARSMRRNSDRNMDSNRCMRKNC